MEGNYIFQVTPESFQADVVEQSKSSMNLAVWPPMSGDGPLPSLNLTLAKANKDPLFPASQKPPKL